MSLPPSRSDDPAALAELAALRQTLEEERAAAGRLAEELARCRQELAAARAGALAESRRRDAFDALLDRLLAGLASVSGAGIDAQVEAALGDACRFLGAAGARVILVSDPQAQVTVAFRWPPAPAEGQGDAAADLRLAPGILERLARGEAVRLGRGAPLEPDCPCEPRPCQPCLSSLLLPMRGGRVRGALCLCAGEPQLAWSQEDAGRLGTLSEAIANAIDRRQAEEALRESERRLRLMATATPTFLLEVDERGVVRYLNRTGDPAGLALIGSPLRSFLPPSDQPMVDEFVREAFESGEPQSVEYAFARPDGETRVFIGQLNPYPEAGGPRLGLLTVTDITVWRRTIEALHDADLKYRRLVENARDMILFVRRADGRIIDANQAAVAAYGYPAEELLRLKVGELRAPEAAPGIAASLDSGAPAEDPFETVHLRRSGERFPVEITSLRPEFESGEVLMAVVRDLSFRRRAEEALRESEQRLRGLYDNAPIGIFHSLAEGQLLRANPALARIFGYKSPEEMVEALGKDGLPAHRDPQVRSQAVAEVQDRDDWVSYDARFSRLDGSTIDGRVTMRRVLDPGGRLLYLEGFFEDTTLRKRAEAERDQLFNLSADLFVVSSLDGELKQWNPAVQRTLGWSREELQSRPFIDFIHPEDRHRLVEGLLSPPQAPIVIDDELRVEARGGDYRWIAWSSFSLPGDNLVFSVGRDVTDKKREEQSRLQLETQLRQSQKMEGIGRLAGGIAHDFNNVLAVILSYASFVKGAVEESGPIHSDVQEIEMAATRAAELTRQLLAFSRKSVVNPVQLDVNLSLAALEKMIRRIVGEDITLLLHHAEGLWPVKLDPSFIDQVMLNLVVNARDAMPVGGRLLIETANAGPGETRRPADMPAGDYVRISVSDSGTGMTREVQEHLFEPFFTTKREGKGTGLGLATVYGIVKQSEGYIFVESEVGKGSRFDLYFPRSREADAPRSRRHSGSFEAMPSATVLVVDDEAALRRIAVRTLEARGYRVIEAEGGAEALARAAAFPGDIDIVLTDVIMPDMNGRQMVERLRAERPHVLVLYMSGYTDDTINRHGILESEVNFIQKPFTPRSLLAQVAALVRIERQG